jgi:predicted dinucleotide-binding enzyme
MAGREIIMKTNRRKWLGIIASSGLIGVLPVNGAAEAPSKTTGKAARQKPRIGVIGAGNVGSTVGGLWVRAGYSVMFSSRHPDQLKPLVARLGALASAGTPQEAAAYGDVIFLAVPYGALPALGRDLAGPLRGKVVLDACNPFPGRDGPIAEQAVRDGVGITSATLLPDTRLVRAFNSLGASVVGSQAHRTGAPLAIPIAGDDSDALAVASRLIRDAGLEPVVIGPLASARLTQPGGPGWLAAETAPELRRRLGLPAAAAQ